MTKDNNSTTPKEHEMTIDTSKTESPVDANEKTIRERRSDDFTPNNNSPRPITFEPEDNPWKGMEPETCRIPEERPSEIKRYHVEERIYWFAVASRRTKRDVRLQVYRIFNKRAMAKGFNIFVEANRQKVAIIEAIRRRGLMDKLYDIVIKCMAEYNKTIPEKPYNDGSIPPNSGSFTGME